jgi:putative membrane protein
MWGLEYFSFRDLWSPYFMGFMMAVAVLYTFVVGPWREKFGGGIEAVPFKRQFVFLLAIALLYVTQGGPLSLMGHLMFTFHMTDMAISYLVVPPMLLYGIPAWLWRWAFGRSFWRPLKFLAGPGISLFLFNLLFSFYHIPGIHDWVMVHYFAHAVYYVVLLIAALLNWWQISCPVPEWQRLTPLRRIGFIFANGILLTPACVMIIFASDPLFAVYNDPAVWVKAMGYCMAGDPSVLLTKFDGPKFFNLMSVQNDQQLGGIVMKLLQEFIDIIALLKVFSEWYRKERAKEDEPGIDEAAAAGHLNNV